MAKQSAADRRKRLDTGRCPIHGIGMPQAEGFHKRKECKLDGDVAVVECPRRDCGIEAYAAGGDGPFQIKKEWEHIMLGEE